MNTVLNKRDDFTNIPEIIKNNGHKTRHVKLCAHKDKMAPFLYEQYIRPFGVLILGLSRCTTHPPTTASIIRHEQSNISQTYRRQ